MTSKEMEYIQAETPKYVGELANVQISILSPTELEIVARERSAVEHAKDMIQRVRKQSSDKSQVRKKSAKFQTTLKIPADLCGVVTAQHFALARKQIGAHFEIPEGENTGVVIEARKKGTLQRAVSEASRILDNIFIEETFTLTPEEMEVLGDEKWLKSVRQQANVEISNF